MNFLLDFLLLFVSIGRSIAKTTAELELSNTHSHSLTLTAGGRPLTQTLTQTLAPESHPLTWTLPRWNAIDTTGNLELGLIRCNQCKLGVKSSLLRWWLGQRDDGATEMVDNLLWSFKRLDGILRGGKEVKR